MIELPREIVWDYPRAPRDELWRLQRLADFFPHYGRDRDTVAALYRRRMDLKMPREACQLIEMYARHHGVADASG